MKRVHVGLDVADLNQAVRFYADFLGIEPTRVLGGYAQFLLDEPGLNLALTERAEIQTARGHFGIEVSDLEMVDALLSRAQERRLNPDMESESLCCHSRQEKFGVRDPDGHRWEVFWVRERMMTLTAHDTDTGCCHAG